MLKLEIDFKQNIGYLLDIDMPAIVSKTLPVQGTFDVKKRSALKNYFIQTFDLYTDLFTCLKNDQAFYTKANSLRHPLIFYYAHTAVFYMNKLKVCSFLDTGINDHIESTMAIGVDEMSWDDLDESTYDWPSIETVFNYRQSCRKKMLAYIDSINLDTKISQEHPMWIIMMGIEHERIHLETSSVLIRELPIEWVQKHPHLNNIAKDKPSIPKQKLLHYPEQSIDMGNSPDTYAYYAWDNEFGQKQTCVPSFKISKYLVSNEEFMPFVQSNAYNQTQYWTEEGKTWKSYTQTTQPYFWRKSGDTYRLRIMTEEIDMPWSWPIEVNYHEAKAFCNWKSQQEQSTYRLPSEEEWYVCAQNAQLPQQTDWAQAPGNINLEHFHSPCPVDTFEFESGIFDLMGNVWQWTETHMDGFKGFKPHKAYDDFSTPTFDGKHNMIKGGSWISTGNLSMLSSRYAFRRHFFQHAGFRYVQGEAYNNTPIRVYENDEVICQMLHSNYLQPCAQKFYDNILKHIDFEAKQDNALIVGSSSGRMAFELSPYFHSITELAQSARQLIAPIQILKEGLSRYVLTEDKELKQYHEINSKHFGFDISNEIQFLQCNFDNLSIKQNHLDLLILNQSIDDTDNIDAFLDKSLSKLNLGGTLMVLSKGIFKDTSLGGFKSSEGESVFSLKQLYKKIKSQHFIQQHKSDIKFHHTQNTRSEYVYTLNMTVWKKTAAA